MEIFGFFQDFTDNKRSTAGPTQIFGPVSDDFVGVSIDFARNIYSELGLDVDFGTDEQISVLKSSQESNSTKSSFGLIAAVTAIMTAGLFAARSKWHKSDEDFERV